MSGYLVKIEVFITADPRKPETMQKAAKTIEYLSRAPAGILQFGLIPEWEAGEPRWLANRKNSAPQPSGAPAGQDGGGEAGPQSQASPRSDGAFGDLERQMRGA